MKADLASLRREYLLASLDEKDVREDPLTQFQKWFDEALNSGIEDVNAMSLCTVDNAWQPHSRIVLLKDVSKGQFVFFTNYLSAKGRQMAGNEQVSLTFYWKELQRQVRIEGRVSRVSETASDEYFASRPLESRLGAWASSQSEVLSSRAELEEQYRKLYEKYADGNVPRPPYWGGYGVDAHYIEFWQGRANRLHDRIAYSRDEEGRWQIYRLNP